MGQLTIIFVKLQAKSLDYELTLLYPCHKKKHKKKKNPNQNLSEGGVLKGLDLTHRLVMGFYLSLGG